MKQHSTSMKKIYSFLVAILISSFGFGQYNVNFEGSGETKTSYGSGNVTLSGIQWNITEGLIGTASNDFKNGSRSVRLRGRNGSSFTMNANKTDGIGTISFVYRRYGSDSSQQPWAVEYSDNNGSSWTQIGSNITATGTVQTFNESVNVSGDIRVRIRLTTTPGTSGNRRMNVDDISITDALAGPNITLSETTISGLDYVGPGPSAEQTFTVEGSLLTDDIVLTAPTNFEISETSNSGFTSSITLSQTSGSVNSTTIYTRLISGLAINTYNGTLTATSSGATQKDISLSGEVAAPSYCDAGPTDDSDSEIENVTLVGENNSINNDTTNNCTGGTGGIVNDFTAQSADLEQNGTYTLSVEFGDCDNNDQYDGAGGVWIDWNNDYDFDDANEEIGTAAVAVGSGNVTENFTINVPSGQATGTYRMRIVQEESGSAGTISPCGTFDWGSVEDYTIEIIAESTNTKAQFVSSSASVSEGSNTYNLEIEIENPDATNATTVEIALTGGTGNAADINNYTTQTITFPAGSSANQNAIITITDDSDFEPNETLVFTLQNISGGNAASIGTQNSFTLTLENNDSQPPITLPYSEDFSDCGTVEWTPYDETGDDAWICDSGDYTMNGFGGTDDVDWLISDFRIDFDTYSNVVVDITTRERYGNSVNENGEFEFLYSTDYSGSGDPTTATWTALTFNPNNTSSGSTYSSNSTTTVNITGVSGIGYLAFKYDMTSVGAAEEWVLRDISIEEGKDADTEVYEPTTQVGATTIVAADHTTSANAEDVFGFVVEDQGTSDGLPTNITTMRFVPGPNNTADWTDHIQGITLYDENLTDYTPTTNITDTEITLDFSTPISIADGTSLEFLLGVYLNTSNISDGSVIQLQIEDTNSGFEANNSGSNFTNDFLLDDVTSNNITIDVQYTEFAFSQQPPLTVGVNEAMSDVIVQAQDSNGNIDTDYSFDMNITSSGTLTTSPLTVAAVNGVATFSGITHTAIGTGLALTADDGLLTSVVSSNFDVIVPPVVIAIQDFDNSAPEWTYSTEIPPFNNGWGGGFFGVIDISSASPLNYSGFQNNILGENDLEDSPGGTSSFVSTFLENVDISGYEDVVLTFDWQVIGYNANNDDARYEVFYDGVGQGIVFLHDGNGAPTSDEGTVSISIPNNVNFVSLETEIRNNGTTGYSGFDNFKLEGQALTSTTYTYNGTWSPSDPNGAATSVDTITITSGDATISSNTSINTVTVNAGASLTIDSGSTLTVADVMTLESTSTSYASLILDGSVSGTVTYERFVNSNSNGNDLIATPLNDESWSDFINPALNNNAANLLDNGDTPTIYAFAPFDKTAMPAADYVNFDSNSTATITNGVGYRAATDAGASLTFTGAPQNGTISVAISESGVGFEEWNLIGNPYASYISAYDFLNHNINNNAVLDNLSGAIYGYNAQNTNKWDIINLSSAMTTDVLIAPGQGFFIASGVPAGNAQFTTDGTPSAPDMRRTNGGDDFIANRTTDPVNYNLELTLSTTNANFNTDFYFNTMSSQGLDPGFDSQVFGGSAPGFAIYSHLVQDNTGIPMAIQSLSDTDLTSVTIALGVNANQGEQVTFSISETTLPSSINVYLEDNVANTFTLLNTSDYVLTPNTNLSNTGRFYLHFSNSVLSISDNTFDGLTIYTNASNRSIAIAGDVANNTIAKVYDIQGRLIVSKPLTASLRLQTIDMTNVNTGVYIVELNNGNQNKTQKVILK